MAQPPNSDNSQGAAEEASPIRQLLLRFVRVERGEVAAMFGSAAFFFFILFGYFMIRPVRDAFGIARGAERLPWLVTATLIAMILVNPLFAALVSRFSRRAFIPIAFQFAVVCLITFYTLIQTATDDWRVRFGYVFFVWLSVFNLFAISLFWATMADVYSKSQSKRLFGFIAAGGTLGTIAGSLLVGQLVKGISLGAGQVLQVQPVTLLIIAIVPLELAVLCFAFVHRQSRAVSATEQAARMPQDESAPNGGSLAGLKILSKSRYLQMIALYVFIYSTTSTILYYELNRWIEVTFTNEAERVRAFANVSLISNVITFFAQIVLTSRTVRSIGVGLTMALVPIITLAGFLVTHRWPTFAAVKWFQVVRNSSHHVFDRPVRETLYTVLDDESKYKAKPFIDTFIYRSGDQIGIWGSKFLGTAGVAVGYIAVPLAVAWIVLALVLGRGQQNRVAESRH